jgi:hypothetical protein
MTRREIEQLLKERGFWRERVTKHHRWTNGKIAFSISHCRSGQSIHAVASMLSVLRRLDNNKPITPRRHDVEETCPTQ